MIMLYKSNTVKGGVCKVIVTKSVNFWISYALIVVGTLRVPSLIVVGTLRVPSLIVVGTLRVPSLISSRHSPCAVSSEKR